MACCGVPPVDLEGKMAESCFFSSLRWLNSVFSLGESNNELSLIKLIDVIADNRREANVSNPSRTNI